MVRHCSSASQTATGGAAYLLILLSFVGARELDLPAMLKRSPWFRLSSLLCLCGFCTTSRPSSLLTTCG
jgi:hypothetical protein